MKTNSFSYKKLLFACSFFGLTACADQNQQGDPASFNQQQSYQEAYYDYVYQYSIIDVLLAGLSDTGNMDRLKK